MEKFQTEEIKTQYLQPAESTDKVANFIHLHDTNEFN